jgi:hypothetical protein
VKRDANEQLSGGLELSVTSMRFSAPVVATTFERKSLYQLMNDASACREITSLVWTGIGEWKQY